MAVKSRDILKTYFETGDFPTQEQFWDWLDSFVHVTEDRGNRVLFGAGAPATSLGQNNDTYLRTTYPYDVFQKLSGNWQYRYSSAGLVWLQRTGNEFQFDRHAFYGSPANPVTSTELNFDMSGAQPGVEVIVWHQSAFVPEQPPAVVFTRGSYVTGQLNRLRYVFIGGTAVELYYDRQGGTVDLSTRLSDRGAYDASSNTFPTTGGTGAGGAIERGNTWYITVAGVLGGVSVGVGSRIMAKIDAPATDADWLVTPIGIVSADSNNSATLGSDGKIFVPAGGGVQSGTRSQRLAATPSVGDMWFQTNELIGLWLYAAGRWAQIKPYDMIFDFTFGVKSYNSSPGITLVGSGGGDWRSNTGYVGLVGSSMLVNSFEFYTAAASAQSGFRMGPGFFVENFRMGVDSAFVYHTKVWFPELSDATNGYVFRAGYNAGGGVLDGSGAYFKYSHDINGGNWQCISSGVGVTTINTTSAVARRTAYDLVMVKYAGSPKIEYFINGELVGQSTSNLENKVFDTGAWIQRTSGTAVRSFLADRLKMYKW